LQCQLPSEEAQTVSRHSRVWLSIWACQTDPWLTLRAGFRFGKLPLQINKGPSGPQPHLVRRLEQTSGKAEASPGGCIHALFFCCRSLFLFLSKWRLLFELVASSLLQMLQCLPPSLVVFALFPCTRVMWAEMGHNNDFFGGQYSRLSKRSWRSLTHNTRPPLPQGQNLTEKRRKKERSIGGYSL
jgi:hypothetical protein